MGFWPLSKGYTVRKSEARVAHIKKYGGCYVLSAVACMGINARLPVLAGGSPR